MRIGSGIFLLAVGAILAFALDVTVEWIDLSLVGFILIAAGVLVTIIGLFLILLSRRRSSVSDEVGPPLRPLRRGAARASG